MSDRFHDDLLLVTKRFEREGFAKFLSTVETHGTDLKVCHGEKLLNEILGR
jgi:hypothetical protein